jgi:hypothetical protein
MYVYMFSTYYEIDTIQIPILSLADRLGFSEEGLTSEHHLAAGLRGLKDTECNRQKMDQHHIDVYILGKGELDI